MPFPTAVLFKLFYLHKYWFSQHPLIPGSTMPITWFYPLFYVNFRKMSEMLPTSNMFFYSPLSNFFSLIFRLLQLSCKLSNGWTIIAATLKIHVLLTKKFFFVFFCKVTFNAIKLSRHFSERIWDIQFVKRGMFVECRENNNQRRKRVFLSFQWRINILGPRERTNSTGRNSLLTYQREKQTGELNFYFVWFEEFFWGWN